MIYDDHFLEISLLRGSKADYNDIMMITSTLILVSQFSYNLHQYFTLREKYNHNTVTCEYTLR